MTPQRESDATLRIALLLFEATVLDAERWQALARKAGLRGDKGAWEILNQDVSLTAIKELLFLDLIPGRSVSGFQQALTAAVRIHPAELAETLRKNEPDVAKLCHFFISRDLMVTEALERVLDRAERDGQSVYDGLVAGGLITPELVERAIAPRDSEFAHANRIAFARHILEFNSLVKDDRFEDALHHAEKHGCTLAESLEKLSILPQGNLVDALEKGVALPGIELMTTDLDPGLLDCFPRELMRRQMFLPTVERNGTYHIATADPFNTALADTLALLTGRGIVFYYARHNDLLGKFQFHFPFDETEREEGFGITAPVIRDPNVLKPAAAQPRAAGGGESAPFATGRTPASGTASVSSEPFVDNMSAVQLVSQIVEGAISAKATDIHVEPQTDSIRVRYRVDGQLLTVMRAPLELLPSITSRIKVLAGMNVTERRRPQDGHCSFSSRTNSYDLRISTMPTRAGEKIAMRVLDASRVMTGLAELGLEGAQLQTINRLISRPSGLVLVTGPTGSGKTSTLYACLCTVNRENVNIITIENPIEYQLEGITQVQVDPGIELGFADGLRSALRQDPDVIMVGEVRDPHTARTAVGAALTGHLVFSTMHASTAVSAVNTLANMGVPDYLVAPAVSGILSQRLVRCICGGCRREYSPPQGELAELGVTEPGDAAFHQGVGCEACFNTGFSGRTGVFEVVEVTDELRTGLLEHRSMPEIEAIARQRSVSLVEAGRQKVFAGVTTAAEAVKAVVMQ